MATPSRTDSGQYEDADSEQDEDADSERYEDTHVHGVYEQIAEHFSSTRYKPWPLVEQFVRDLPAGAVGIDVGCGNGKYLHLNPNVFILGSDRSTNLVRIASQRGAAAVVAENLALPHRGGVFDFALSIAVVHHLSTRARRIRAIAALLHTLRAGPDRGGSEEGGSEGGGGKGGEAFIYVWALEQKHSRRGWDASDAQDVLVPWVMKRNGNGNGNGGTYHRFYHLYRQGELEEDVRQAGGLVHAAGFERDNWWAVVRRPA